MSSYTRPADQEVCWVRYTICTFIAIYAAIVLGGVTLAIALREYVKSNVPAPPALKAK